MDAVYYGNYRFGECTEVARGSILQILLMYLDLYTVICIPDCEFQTMQLKDAVCQIKSGTEMIFLPASVFISGEEEFADPGQIFFRNIAACIFNGAAFFFNMDSYASFLAIVSNCIID